MGWAQRANEAGLRSKSVGPGQTRPSWDPHVSAPTSRRVTHGKLRARAVRGDGGSVFTKPGYGTRRARRRVRNAVAKASRRRNRVA